MTSDHGGGSITSVLQETRVFPPPSEFASKAHIKSLAQYETLWNQAKDDPEGFWAEHARVLSWAKPWDEVLDWQPPFAKWFVGGQLNAAYNCVDRHCLGPSKNKAAIIWEGEPGDRRVFAIKTSCAKSRSSPMCSKASVSKRGTWSRSICRSFPSW